jgi:hypothetical protein
VGLAFDMPNGQVMRLALTRADLDALIAADQAYRAGNRVQSSMESLSPSSPKSTPLEGENV